MKANLHHVSEQEFQAYNFLKRKVTSQVGLENEAIIAAA